MDSNQIITLPLGLQERIRQQSMFQVIDLVDHRLPATYATSTLRALRGSPYPPSNKQNCTVCIPEHCCVPGLCRTSEQSSTHTFTLVRSILIFTRSKLVFLPTKDVGFKGLRVTSREGLRNPTPHITRIAVPKFHRLFNLKFKFHYPKHVREDAAPSVKWWKKTTSCTPNQVRC